MDEIRTAKLFKNGNSQAVRLPKDFRFEGDEVLVMRHGDDIILRTKAHHWDSFFRDKTPVPDSYMENIEDLPPQKRDIF
jgi:antitoxin VapB